MMQYYIDQGSSTIKVYSFDGTILKLVEEHSIYLKNGFSKEKGITEDNLELLYGYYAQITKKYHFNFESTYIFATGIFREIPAEQKFMLVKEFNKKFDLYFNVISHGIENYYIGKAMESDNNGKKVMVINMGGKTTELVTFENNKITQRHNLKVGVADLLNKFPNSNDKYSTARIEDMVDFVKERIKNEKFDTDYDCAIFTGGELRFEKLTKYELEDNDLFFDNIHDKKVSFENFVKGNEKIFYQMTLDELYALMPQNPKWMDGARAGAVLPQAIFEKAKIKTIIPSDMNLINGVIKDI